MSVALEELQTRAPELPGGLARHRRLAVALGDLTAVAGAYVATWLVMAGVVGGVVSVPGWLLAVLMVAGVPFWLLVFSLYGLYENDRTRISASSLDGFREIFHAILAGSLLVVLLDETLAYTTDARFYGAGTAVIFIAAALVLVPLARTGVRAVLNRRADAPQRTVIVGGGVVADRIYRKLEACPEYGLNVVGFLNDDDFGMPASARHLGQPEDIADVIDRYGVDRVVVAFSTASHEETLELVRSVRRPDVHVSIVPRFFEVFTSRASVDDVHGMPLITLAPMRLGLSSRILKRTFDLVVAGTALLVLAPVLAAVALAVRLDSPGQVLYRQPRRGRGGSEFRIYKFRSMFEGAESRRGEMLHLNEVDGPLFKAKTRDPRVTRVGAFLRSTSLDELPQLINVIRGEMSLVGPRPFVIYEADQITGWANNRLNVTPGITGLWQALGRNDMSFDEMVRLDYLYVTNWSLWWDVKILFRTIPSVLGRQGAY